MLQDARLRSELEEMIRQRHYSPEYAISRTLRRYAQVFQNLQKSHYLAERANDIFDIENRLLRNLLGRRREGLAHLTSPVLVLAHNLTPSETANLDRRFVRGFVTEVGGPGATRRSSPRRWKSPPWSAPAVSSPRSPAATW